MGFPVPTRSLGVSPKAFRSNRTPNHRYEEFIDFVFERSIVRSGDAIYVRVGDHDLTRKYGSPGAQTLRVATTYIHHNHNSQTLDNDIALLKLHGQAELKDGVCLVCLPARGVSHAAGKRCTVTGYGYMGESKLSDDQRPVALVKVTKGCKGRYNVQFFFLFLQPALYRSG